jgi:hypothetical protein
MARYTVRVDIPSDPTELLTLAAKIDAKERQLGDSSPLKALEDAPTFGGCIQRAAAADKEADEFASKAETQIGERNKDLPAVLEGVRARRDTLLGVFRKNPRKLSEFGFVVSDTPADNGSSAPTGPAPASPGPAK